MRLRPNLKVRKGLSLRVRKRPNLRLRRRLLRLRKRKSLSSALRRQALHPLFYVKLAKVVKLVAGEEGYAMSDML